MASLNYTKALQGMISGNINLTGTLKIVLCTAAYVANMATDEFLSSIAAGARVATQTLVGVSVTNGVFDASDVTFPTVPAGSTVTQAVIYIDASPESAARLVRRIDDYPGLPLTTSGTDITFAWPNDARKIFAVENG